MKQNPYLRAFLMISTLAVLLIVNSTVVLSQYGNLLAAAKSGATQPVASEWVILVSEDGQVLYGAPDLHNVQPLIPDGAYPNPALSPDGTMIGYVKLDEQSRKRAVWVMNLDASNPYQVAETGGSPTVIAWSPDGKHLAFIETHNLDAKTFQRAIYTVDLDGQNLKAVATTSADRRFVWVCWTPDGQELVYVLSRALKVAITGLDIWIMKADGSNQRPFIVSNTFDSSPVWSPDGKQIGFTSNRESRSGTRQLYVADASGQNPRKLTEEMAAVDNLVWSPDGKQIMYEVYQQGIFLIDVTGENRKGLVGYGNSWHLVDWRSFKLPSSMPTRKSPVQTLAPSSTPRPATRVPPTATPKKVTPQPPTPTPWPISNEWVLLSYTAQMGEVNSVIYTPPDLRDPKPLARNGTCPDSDSGISADGAMIACNKAGGRPGELGLWVMNLDGTNPRLIVVKRASRSRPNWSPDGKRLAFVESDWDPNKPDMIYTVDVDGKNLRAVAVAPKDIRFAEVLWSPDGKTLIFGIKWTVKRVVSRELWMMDADGANQRLFITSQSSDYSPAWSPDGKQIAFISRRGHGDISGYTDLYVADADGKNPRLLAAGNIGIRSFVWSPNGKQLLYENYASDGFTDHYYLIDLISKNRTELSPRLPHGGHLMYWGNLELSSKPQPTTPMTTEAPGTNSSTPNPGQTMGAIVAASRTAVAAWTKTPTPTVTPTATDMPIPSQIPTVATNNEWEPVVRQFGGVTMVMVPPGCFMMGANGEQDASPVGQVCFDKPFWIDRYDVTNQQFQALNGKAEGASHFTGANQPRTNITWFEARDFCALRGARLPTEAEWEYTARGPDGWLYPWGNDWDANKVVYAKNSAGQSIDVGSKPGGASWVGAMDMSGLVWQWVSSLHMPYQFSKDGAQENPADTKNPRVQRGGSLQNDYIPHLQSANRGRGKPAKGGAYTGFRCARNSDTGDTVAATSVPTQQAALSTVTANAQWTPTFQTFDGVIMALVPAGCFVMGTSQADIMASRNESLLRAEAPQTTVCFSEPFWIDKYDVTNGQFKQFKGKAARNDLAWSTEYHARAKVTWVEARDFCALRGARLLTEAEWEYAARGPDSLTYPWGNDWNFDNVVYHDNSADVGSKPGGVSWVGAMDMSGNVWQWVNTIFKPYPYNKDDGRENNTDTQAQRVQRGGSEMVVNKIQLRSAYRRGFRPDFADDTVGFRCARAFR